MKAEHGMSEELDLPLGLVYPDYSIEGFHTPSRTRALASIQTQKNRGGGEPPVRRESENKNMICNTDSVIVASNDSLDIEMCGPLPNSMVSRDEEVPNETDKCTEDTFCIFRGYTFSVTLAAQWFTIWDIISDLLVLFQLVRYEDWDLVVVTCLSLMLPGACAIMLLSYIALEHSDSDSSGNVIMGCGLCLTCPITCLCVWWFLPAIEVVTATKSCICGPARHSIERYNDASSDDEKQSIVDGWGALLNFFARVLEDIPQICVNIVFTYRHNDGHFALVNIVSMVSSLVMIFYTAVMFPEELKKVRSALESSMGDESGWY